jgi:D-alanine-D-alanine ligase
MSKTPWYADPRPLVAVLAGGFGAERSISEASGRAVCAALEHTEWRPVYIDLSLPSLEQGAEAAPPKPIWTVDQTSAAGTAVLDLGRMALLASDDDAASVPSRAFKAAFVALHGSPGEDGWISGFLDMLGLPHTTASLRASAIAFDKALSKNVVAPSGMALADGRVVHRKAGLEVAQKQLHGMAYPLFVKPNRNGSSCGISRVESSADLPKALEKAWAFGEELLVETAISGREYTCAVYRRKGRIQTLPLCEIVSGKGHAFFDYEAKYTPGEAEELIPAPIAETLAEQIRYWSAEAYRVLGLSGLARIDFMVEEKRCVFLEANTVPGLSEVSIVPRMLTAAGWEHGRFYADMLDEALHPS